jgi:predicted peroxiredoxin
MSKAVVSLNTGLEDAETVTVAFLVAVGAAEQGRRTLMFLTKEAVRLASEGFARAVACDGCPPLADLVERYAKAGGRLLVCPICMQARNVDPSGLVVNAEAGGTVPLWDWIGEDQVVTFSY